MLQKNVCELMLGLITSRCSKKEPALLPAFYRGTRLDSRGWPAEFEARIVHTFILENNFSGRKVCDTDALEILWS